MTRITKAALRLRAEFAANVDAYAWLPFTRPGIMLDVGAAAGRTATRMLAAVPDSHVVAFEPFPGNHPFIEEKIGGDPRVRIVKKAVSDNNEPAKFYVRSTVTHGTGSWSGMEGYSSAGELLKENDPRAQQAMTVATCRLDEEVSEPVRLLKIDVQGAELQVLRGAKNLFDRHGVELVQAEFLGSKRIVRFLASRGYAIFDTRYHSTQKPFDPTDWRVARPGKLSSGQTVHLAEPLHAPESLRAYLAWFARERRKYKSLWTDLIAVAPWSGLLNPPSPLERSLGLLRACLFMNHPRRTVPAQSRPQHHSA